MGRNAAAVSSCRIRRKHEIKNVERRLTNLPPWYNKKTWRPHTKKGVFRNATFSDSIQNEAAGRSAPRPSPQLVEGLERPDKHQALLGRHRSRARPSPWPTSSPSVQPPHPALLARTDETLAAQLLFGVSRSSAPDNAGGGLRSAAATATSPRPTSPPPGHLHRRSTPFRRRRDRPSLRRSSATAAPLASGGTSSGVAALQLLLPIYSLGDPIGLPRPWSLFPAPGGGEEPGRRRRAAGREPAVPAPTTSTSTRGTFRVRGDVLEVYRRPTPVRDGAAPRSSSATRSTASSRNSTP